MSAEKRLTTAERDELRRDPRFKARMLVPNMLIGAFFVCSAVYFVIAALGVLQQSAEEPSGDPLWWVLVAAAAGLVPVQFLLGRQLMTPVRRARTFEAVMGRALLPLIAALAVGEAAVILGMMTLLLKAPDEVAYATMGAGVVFMLASGLIVRAKIVSLALRRIKAEKKRPAA